MKNEALKLRWSMEGILFLFKYVYNVLRWSSPNNQKIFAEAIKIYLVARTSQGKEETKNTSEEDLMKFHFGVGE